MTRQIFSEQAVAAATLYLLLCRCGALKRTWEKRKIPAQQHYRHVCSLSRWLVDRLSWLFLVAIRTWVFMQQRVHQQLTKEMCDVCPDVISLALFLYLSLALARPYTYIPTTYFLCVYLLIVFLFLLFSLDTSGPWSGTFAGGFVDFFGV